MYDAQSAANFMFFVGEVIKATALVVPLVLIWRSHRGTNKTG